MDAQTLTTEVSPELADKIGRFADEEGCSTGEIIRSALEAWVAREEEHHRLIREGLAAIEAGDVVDHDVIKAWAESLGTESPLPPPR